MTQELASDERTFLRYLETTDNDKATMRELRINTALDENERQYRFETLAEKGYIEVEKDRSLTDNGTPMKVATLTEEGWKVIQEGALDGDDYDEPFNAEDKYHELEQTFEEKIGLAEGVASRIANVEDRLDTNFNPLVRAMLDEVIQMKAEREDISEQQAWDAIKENRDSYRPDE